LLECSWSSFHICGVTGLALGTSLALTLGAHAGLSRAVVVVLLASGVFTFLALAMATKIVTGRESLVYYHHEVAILSVSAGLLAALGLPVLPYLDVTALGLGVFLACGRCGCLLVGCCHGKPYRWGVRYGHEHAKEGFPDCYVGARLFPVQALEAMVVGLIVSAGALAILQGRPAGTAWSLYVISYSTVRICLEELRGDGTRPYWLRLSEAQWTSLALILAILAAEWQGRLSWSWWHASASVVAAMSLLWFAIRRSGAHALLHPRHAGEIAEIVHAAPSTGRTVAVYRTSQTIGVSSQPLGGVGSADAMLYSISRADRRLTVGEAASIANLIVDLAPAAAAPELVRGAHDVFHLIVRSERQ
jgi:prolipoprotein diacylglyceryltransferase